MRQGALRLRPRARRRPLRGAARARRRAASTTATWEAAAETIARRLRHYANLLRPGRRSRSSPPASRRNEEAYAWREVVRGRRRRRARRRRARRRLGAARRPTRATIADLDAADLIVIAGDREPATLAGVLELRVRKAVRRGARLVLAGAGGTQPRPARDASASRRRPASLVDSADAIVERLAGAERPVLLVTDPRRLRAGRVGSRRRGGLARQGRRRAAAARGAERAAASARAGFRDDPASVLARAERGELQDAGRCSATPIRSRAARTPSRWRDALQRAESVVVSTLFPNEATGWAHVILPATATLEKEGSTTNLEGRDAAPAPDAPAADGRRPRARARSASRGRQLDARAADARAGRPPPPRRRRARALRRAGRRPRRAGAPPRRARPKALGRPRAPRGPRRQRAGGLQRRRLPAALLGPAVDARRAPRASSAATRSCSRAPTPCGSASPRASRSSSRIAGGRTTGPLRRLAHARRRAPCACRGTGAPVDRRVPPSRPRARHARRRSSSRSIKAFVLVNLLMGFFAVMTVIERKLIGRLQTRYGPNRVGPIGLLQPIADLGKLAQKQHAIPYGAHRAPVPGRAVHLAVRRDRGVRRDPVRRRGARSPAPTGRSTCTSATRTSASCTSPRSARWASTAC